MIIERVAYQRVTNICHRCKDQRHIQRIYSYTYSVVLFLFFNTQRMVERGSVTDALAYIRYNVMLQRIIDGI